VAAITRSRNEIDLFAVGDDGRVYTAWWRDGDGWSSADGRWDSIGGDFAASAPVAAITRSRNDIDLFAVGDDGRVYTAWWRDGDGWSSGDGRWDSIGGDLPDGAPLTAISRSRDAIDLFAVARDARVSTAWWREGDGWSSAGRGFSPIGGDFAVDEPVTAITRSDDEIDLFVTGGDGRVYTAWWREGAGWSSANGDWNSIRGSFPAAAPVAAIARTRDHLDLFATGDDGGVGTSWWRDGNGWSP
jgi:hypothetical protein